MECREIVDWPGVVPRLLGEYLSLFTLSGKSRGLNRDILRLLRYIRVSGRH